MFNEKDYEEIFENGVKTELQVWQSPKYKESKEKAIEIINKYKDKITEGDFWILMNKTKSGKMAYTGLIISHNGCLKLNDEADEEDKVKPECFSVDKDGYNNSLVYTYCSPAQKIFEVGEVSKTNCKNDYPYAMAFKRCFDRVVLKISKIAYAGIYSEEEADEFKRPIEEEVNVQQAEKEPEIIGGAFVLTGGKYDGKTIQEVFEIDKDYVEICANKAKNFNIRQQFKKCMTDNGYIPTVNV